MPNHLSVRTPNTKLLIYLLAAVCTTAIALGDHSTFAAGGDRNINSNGNANSDHDRERHRGLEEPAVHDHAMHAQKAMQAKLRRSHSAISIPDLPLVNQDDQPVRLNSLVDGSKPVLVNFIFTTCTAICPLMSATFSGFQKAIGEAESERVRLISISIDPEHDTPEKLREYARRHGAHGDWLFLTGEFDDIVATERAFDVYRGNKMNHEATTFMRGANQTDWIRMDGLASASQLVAEYRKINPPTHK